MEVSLDYWEKTSAQGFNTFFNTDVNMVITFKTYGAHDLFIINCFIQICWLKLIFISVDRQTMDILAIKTTVAQITGEALILRTFSHVLPACMHRGSSDSTYPQSCTSCLHAQGKLWFYVPSVMYFLLQPKLWFYVPSVMYFLLACTGEALILRTLSHVFPASYIVNLEQFFLGFNSHPHLRWMVFLCILNGFMITHHVVVCMLPLA